MAETSVSVVSPAPTDATTTGDSRAGALREAGTAARDAAISDLVHPGHGMTGSSDVEPSATVLARHLQNRGQVDRGSVAGNGW
jgi:hypothetical protein